MSTKPITVIPSYTVSKLLCFLKTLCMFLMYLAVMTAVLQSLRGRWLSGWRWTGWCECGNIPACRHTFR